MLQTDKDRNSLSNSYSSLYYKNIPERLQKLNEYPINVRSYYVTEKLKEKKEVLVPAKGKGSSKEMSSDSEINASILNTIQSQVSASFISKIHTLYMDPAQDIKWRLGDVVRSVPDTKSIVSDKKEAGMTDENGHIFTKVNFFKKFSIPSYLASNKTEYYTNFFFPPYNSLVSVVPPVSLQDIIDNQEVKESKVLSNSREVGGKDCYIDWKSMIDYRGNFTERTPAFKSINDSISYLQWLFERVSGITSTYLTDWDLSLYLQENIFAADNQKLKWISLTYNLMNDTPLNDPESSLFDKNGDPLSFGVLNCAVSKMNGYNMYSWNPEKYPLSANWVPYPKWLYAPSQYSQMTNEDNETVRTPSFYNRVLHASNFLNRENSIKSRILFDDYQGAALSGWTDMSLSYYKAIYTSEEDGINQRDFRNLVATQEVTSNDTLISNNFEENWGASLEKESSEETFEKSLLEDITDYDGDVPSGNLKKKASYRKKATNRASSRVSNSRNTSFDVGSGTITANGENGGGEDPMLESTNTTGICQRNPVLFGGPHGYYLSPLATQSYIESNNSILRDVPRITPIKVTSRVDTATGSPIYEPIFAKESTFKSEDKESDTINRDFLGVEKYYTQSSLLGLSDIRPYEQSYTKDLRYLKEGFHDKGITATAVRLHRVYKTFDKEHYVERYYSSSEERWIETPKTRYPSYSEGYPIHYLDNNTYTDYGYIIGEVLPDHLCVYANSHFSHGGRCQSVGEYSGVRWNGKTWIGDRRDTGRRRGYIERRENIPYTKYRLHSMPFEHWQLHKTTHRMYQGVKRTKARRAVKKWWNIFGFSFGGGGYYYEDYYITQDVYEPETTYELYFPDSRNFRTSSPMTSSGRRTLYHSEKENELCTKMLDINGGKNSVANLIFLEGNTSLSDRENRGPKKIIRMPVVHKDYSFTYTVSIYHSDGCSSWYSSETRTGWDDFVCVDLENAKEIFAGLQEKYFSNNKASPSNQNFIESCMITESSAGKLEAATPENLVHYISSKNYIDDNGNYTSSCTGLEGWGILSCIPGINSETVIDNPPIENYKKYLKIQEENSKLLNMPLCKIPFCTYTTSAPRDATHWENDRKWLDGNSAPPAVTVVPMDDGLKSAWVRACTMATFYTRASFKKAESSSGFSSLRYYHQVPIDVPFRTFYFQMTYQHVFLEALKELMCSKLAKDVKNGIAENSTSSYVVDFNNLGKLLHGDKNGPGVCGRRTYTISNPDNNAKLTSTEGKPLSCPDVFGFNQWIREGRRTFEEYEGTSPSDNQDLFGSALESRLLIFENAIKKFDQIIKNEASLFSYNNIMELYIEMSKVLESEINPSNQFIERTFYSYLNILYEHRKFFINKRCNKEEGTLWMIRCLEQTMPLVMASTVSVAPSATIFEVENTSNLKVEFYSFQNQNSVKLNTLYSDDFLEEDRINKVYIKVKYTTEEEYLKDQQRVKEGKQSEPFIVKFKKKKYVRGKNGYITKDNFGKIVSKEVGDYVYAEKPLNGMYRLESTEYLNNLSNIEYNKSLPESESSKKRLEKDFDTAIWNIKWGLPSSTIENEQGVTPIIFDIYDAIDLSRALEIMDSFSDSSVEDILCACKVANDYWEVEVKDNFPRPNGYITNIKLNLYNDAAPDDNSPTKTTITEEKLVDNTLCPIVESQKYQGDLSMSSLIKFQENNSGNNLMENNL